MKRFFLQAALLLFILIIPGCSKKPEPQPTPVTDDSPTVGEDGERARMEAEERARREAEERERAMASARTTLSEMVFFDYDDARIRPEAQRILDEKVRVLRQYADVRLRIEGHCDERGSNEYNDALGSRRAASILEYLQGAGVEARRLEMVSFGEDRPMASGHDESAWARNRRGEFRILSGLGG